MTAMRANVFWGDPDGNKAFKHIDEVRQKLFDSLFDPTSPVHKNLSKEQLCRLIDRLITHYEFRANLDWSKEQFYSVPAALPAKPNNILGVNLNLNPLQKDGVNVATFE